MWIIYNLIYLLCFIIYFPLLVLKGKYHGQFLMRFGFFPDDFKKRIKREQNLWIHAVSVGEVLAIVNLLEEVKKSLPGLQIVLSTGTKTGYKVAQSRLGQEDIVVYAPLDLSWAVGAYISLIKPKMYVCVETEIWPNLYRLLISHKIPILIINGRISDKTFHWYKKGGWLFRKILKNVACFCMQSELDSERIKTLGALEERVKVVGSLKFDSNSSAKDSSPGIRINPKDMLVVAGSTHLGEEEILVDIYERIKNSFPDLRLVLAPRHVERTKELVALLHKKGLKTATLSSLDSQAWPLGSILVIDTIGHLASIYKLARLVFIGKTLTAQGGQNMIEPASLGKAVLVGPYTQNFQDVMRLFLQREAMIQVKDAEELYVKFLELLKNPQRIERLGQIAKSVVEENSGATERTCDIIRAMLNGNEH